MIIHTDKIYNYNLMPNINLEKKNIKSNLIIIMSYMTLYSIMSYILQGLISLIKQDDILKKGTQVGTAQLYSSYQACLYNGFVIFEFNDK